MMTEVSLRRGVRHLCDRDADLARVVQRWGVPPLWARTPGFATLLHIILEQQVSLASAGAAMDRLVAAVGQPDPATFLDLSDEELLAIGYSRQKRRYGRALARRILDGEIDLRELEGLPDATARERLTALTGIGPWTADIYLLMALGRPDIWPVGDIALATAAWRLKALPARPLAGELERLGADWAPWRSVAARILWHYYLSDPAARARPPDPGGTAADPGGNASGADS
jgi:DNA-3-methyladenine glycosylase II